MKTCSKCGEVKDFSEFYKQKENCYISQCKHCISKRNKEKKTDLVMKLNKEYKSSIITENKLLKKENKKICCKCKKIVNILEISSKMCKDCISDKNKKYSLKAKEKRQKYWKEYHKQYYLKKKLEKLKQN